MNDPSIIKIRIIQELASIINRYGNIQYLEEEDLTIIYDKLSDLLFDIDQFLGGSE